VPRNDGGDGKKVGFTDLAILANLEKCSLIYED
jgi:hypothetical protein